MVQEIPDFLKVGLLISVSKTFLERGCSAHVETLGQGDVLLVIDAEDELINDIDEMVLENLAAGCTAPGRARSKHPEWCECFRDRRLLGSSGLGPEPAVHRSGSRGAIYLPGAKRDHPEGPL